MNQVRDSRVAGEMVPRGRRQIATLADGGDAPECDVFLYCPPVQDGLLGAARPLLRVLGGASSSSSGTAWYKHWAAVFVYPDGKALYCDANQEAGSGHLVGGLTWRTSEQLALMDVPKLFLGKHRVSPRVVSAALKDMCDRGPYHVTENNCQEWVLELLFRLGIDTPQTTPPPARRVVQETVGPLALGGSLLVGAGLLLISLMGVLIAPSSGNRRRRY